MPVKKTREQPSQEFYCLIFYTMNAHITKLLYIILLLIAPVAANAQGAKPTAGSISGQLQNEQAKPMDYATVTLLRGKDSSVVKSTLTNYAGKYQFDNVI